MRSMLTPSLVWRMAWRNLWTQPRQTLLTVLGGCIGAALIMAAVVFFQSFDESGNRWLKQHYGPIDWELKPPAGTRHFTQEEVQAIAERLQPYNVQLLPAAIFETSVSKVDGQLQPVQTGLRYLAIGVALLKPLNLIPIIRFGSCLCLPIKLYYPKRLRSHSVSSRAIRWRSLINVETLSFFK